MEYTISKKDLGPTFATMVDRRLTRAVEHYGHVVPAEDHDNDVTVVMTSEQLEAALSREHVVQNGGSSCSA